MVEIFKSNNKTVRRVVLISYIFLLFQICFSTFMSIFFSIKKKKLILKKKKKNQNETNLFDNSIIYCLGFWRLLHA